MVTEIPKELAPWAVGLNPVTRQLIEQDYLYRESPLFALNYIRGKLQIASYTEDQDLCPVYGAALIELFSQPSINLHEYRWYFDPRLEHTIEPSIQDFFVEDKFPSEDPGSWFYLQFPEGYSISYADDSGAPKMVLWDDTKGQVVGSFHIEMISNITDDVSPNIMSNFR